MPHAALRSEATAGAPALEPVPKPASRPALSRCHVSAMGLQAHHPSWPGRSSLAPAELLGRRRGRGVEGVAVPHLGFCDWAPGPVPSLPGRFW